MTLRDSTLPALNGVRAVVSALGLRTSRVVVRTVTWSGGSTKLGTATTSDLVITPDPKVTETDNGQGLIVQYITPAHDGGGYTVAQLRPSDAAGTESFYLVTGDNGTYPYALVDIDSTAPLHYTLRLRKLERTDPT